MALDPYQSGQASGGSLANIDESGTPPKSRLATAEAARSMLSGLIRGDNPASFNRTKIQNNIDGFPPLTDDQVKEADIGWVARANWGGARAKIRDYLVAYTDIVTGGSDTLPMVNVTMGDQRNRAEWGQIFSEEYHNTLFQTYDDWSFIYHMKLHHKMLAIHGVGPCFWRDDKDWRFHALKRRNILVPKESPSDVSRLRCVFVRDFMYVDELFEMVPEKGSKEEPKWNRAAALDAIQHAQKKDTANFDWETAQEKYKNNAFDWAYTESDVAKIAHVFVKEFSGKVSHHIFTENATASNSQKIDTGDGYIYSDLDAYDCIGNGLWVCFQDVGNGDFESVRGLGTEAFHFGEAHNRLNNALVNNTIECGTVVWQSDSTEHAQKLTKIEIGPHRLIPAGLTQIPLNNGASINATLSVSQYLSSLEESQSGVFKSRDMSNQNARVTATEIQARVGETSKLSNAAVAEYLVQLDRLLTETWRRLTLENLLETDGGGKEALAFQAKCIARGIPEQYFYKLAQTAVVTASRPIGNGSYADRVQRMSGMAQFMGEMPDRKRKQFVRDYIAYTGGSRDLADRYGPDLEQDFPGIEQSLAILENNGFMAGGTQDPFSPDNDHELHLHIHLPFASGLVQQGDPQHASGVLEALDPHMAQHLEALKNDPTKLAAFNAFEAQIGALQNDIKRLNKDAELMQQQQVPQDQNPELAKVQANAQIQQMATQADIADKAAKTKQALAIKDATAAQKMRHAEETHRQQLAIAAESAKAKTNGNGQ